jgi:hypothetical protein
MRSLLSAVLLTFALGTALPAQVRTFQLAGTFESGATFSGFFTMNGAARSLLSWNITTQAEPGWIERTYTSGGTGSSSFGGNSSTVPNEFGFAVRQSTSSMFVVWFSGQATTFTGGAIQPHPASCQTVPSGCAPAWEAVLNSSDARFVSGGTATLVPEPSAALLLVPALGGLLLRTARRRGQQVA